MRTTLIDQIISRRLGKGIRTSQMPMVAGINRQQYEKIEKGGNPSLVTLDKIAEGLDAELMLIPKEKLGEVRQILSDQAGPADSSIPSTSPDASDEDVEDPWARINTMTKLS